MDKILHDLGELLLKAIPTFLLVWLLYLYLARMFFRPLDRVLAQREQATEGTRKLAEETFARAAEQAARHEAAIRAARAEIYQEQEALRQQWRREHASALEQARRQAEAMVKEAEQRLAAERLEAERLLEWIPRKLAGEIADRVLARRVM